MAPPVTSDPVYDMSEIELLRQLVWQGERAVAQRDNIIDLLFKIQQGRKD